MTNDKFKAHVLDCKHKIVKDNRQLGDVNQASSSEDLEWLNDDRPH